MASQPYISPYIPNERTRRSVMAAHAFNKSIDEVFEREARIKPRFDEDSFSGALGTITLIVEGLCVEGAEGWYEKQRIVPEVLRISERLRGASLAPIVGNDRATMSLFDPLEGLENLLNKFLLGVEGWANKAKYFKEVARPFIVRTIENSISEASTAKKLRKQLDFVGPIEMSYVRSFENFSHAIEEPILELRELVEFIASILKDGDEISLPGSMPATSPHFNTILNPEPATQTSASGHVKTDDQYGSSAFEDSRQAAGYSSAMNKSPSPSYSPPPSPSPSVNTLLKPFSVPWITAEEPSLDRPSPMLLQPSALYQTKRSPAPPRTPHWKIDLNDRKGHPINKLHVGPQELDILARCLKLVHSATRKGEECMRVIIENQALATEMQAEYEQWDEFCMDVEDNVSIDAREARHETEQDFGYTKVDDDAKGKGKAKDPTIYGRATAHGSTDNFDSAGDYGRIGPRAPQTAWGYRKFDAPASKGQTHFPRLTSLPEDPDETEDEADECDVRPGKKRRLGTDSQASTERGLGSPMSLSDSDRTDGVEEVMNFEEAFEEEEEGPDQEMEDVGLGAAGAGGIVDVGDGDEDDGDGEGGKGKKGLVGGGGKVLGLYGEEL